MTTITINHGAFSAMLPPDWLPPNYHELKTEASKLTIDRIASRDVNTNIVFHQGFIYLL